MAQWHPQKILAQGNLRLSQAEKEIIIKKMPPPDDEGQIYADAIFEGGGVRGVAFLGALRCCADLGLRWRKLAGTSAGAITAAFLAADFSIDELEKILGELNYNDKFLTQKTSPLIFNGNPADDLRFPLPMLISLALTRQIGEYSSEPFRDWLKDTLSIGNITTFADVEQQGRGRELKVVISDITRGEMLVMPDDLQRREPPLYESLYEQLKLTKAEDFSVAEAVRLSMSIPLFFTPGKLLDNLIVDGGILSNFPLWIYDRKPGMNATPPRWFTFGFRLLDKGIEDQVNINGPLGLLSAVFRTMMNARDRYHQRESDKGRVINIDVTEAGVTATDFNLDFDRKAQLYRLGYQYTKNFFLNPACSWEKHLIARGFGALGDNSGDDPIMP
ncbi:phospholipase [Oscillatoriales cyanobacterium USR001]|nr:phospholipase [Oscillatoriales cyanobacterium USR001]